MTLRLILHFPFVIFHLPFIPGTPRSARKAAGQNEKLRIVGARWPFGLAVAAILLIFNFANAQTPAGTPGDPNARVIDGVNNGTVFGMGQSIRITGIVKEGAIAFGGDVIVEGKYRDGMIHAQSVMTSCPSKYEAEAQQQQGGAVPGAR